MNSPETITAGTLDGKLYAYPETNDNGYYLVYDKTVVPEDKVGKLEDVLAACKAAGKKFIFDCGNGFYSCTFAFTAGVKIDGLEEDGVTQKFVQYDEAEAVKTLQAFSKLIKEYKGTFTSLDVAQIASGFSTGTLGAGVDGSWNTTADQDALKDKFGAAKLPTVTVDGTEKQLVSLFGYKYIGVNASLRSSLTISQARPASSRELRSSVGVPPTRLYRKCPLLRTAPYCRLSLSRLRTLALRLTSLLPSGLRWATSATS